MSGPNWPAHFDGSGKERLCALVRFFLRVCQRLAQDDPAIDRDDFKLKRKTLAVLVMPGSTDFVPVRFLALLSDVPGNKVWSFSFRGSGFCVACHDISPLVWVGLL